MASVFIATAGWGVPRELSNRAPSEGTGLTKYATLLGATEINSTFQQRHRPSTFARWHDSVPSSFRFAVKLPRRITHEAALAAPRAELAAFFSEIGGLGEKLGPILVQLPASVPFDLHRARTFFRILRELHSGFVACEPRHASWYDEPASTLMRQHDIARVVADPPRPPAAARPGGTPSLRYVRWHGSPDIYRSAYGQARIAPLAEEISKAPSGTVFWCVFDNTASGAALADALCLQSLLSTRSDATRPLRLRRSRAKGERLTSPNGLPIVCVSRPSKWGNPYSVELARSSESDKSRIRAIAVNRFRDALLSGSPALPFRVADVQRELRGKNVACWCPLDGPCHGDVLLELANA